MTTKTLATAGHAAYANGYRLGSTANLTNTGVTLINDGTVGASASQWGIEIYGSANTVLNFGIIGPSANSYPSAGVVFASGSNNVLFNEASGTLSSGLGGGFYSGSDSAGHAPNSTLINAGLILGNPANRPMQPGVILEDSGVVTNLSTGTIKGNGVEFYNGYIASGSTPTSNVSLVNSGTILGGPTYGAVFMRNGGNITNLAGTISGNGAGLYGISIANKNSLDTPSTITNAGTIAGGSGADALYMATVSGNRLIDQAGGVFIGTVNGGANATMELASSASTGTLAATGGQFTHFSTLNIDSGAQWIIKGDGALSTEFPQIGGFTVGDTISLTGLAQTPTTFASSTGTVSGTVVTSVIIKAGATPLETITLLGSIASGRFTFVAGATSTLTENGVAPSAPAITGISPDTGVSSTDGTTDTGALTIDGTAPSGATIDVFDGGTQIGSGTASGTNFAITLGTPLTAGNHTLTATAIVSGGTSSPSGNFVVDVDETAPAVTEALVSDTGSSGTDHVTSNDALTGGGDSGATVTFKEGGSTIGSTTANIAGTWNFTPTLSNGGHTIVASETDAAGNTGTASLTFTLDTVAPSVISIDTVGSTSNSGGTEQFTVTFSEAVTGVDTGDFTLADTGTVTGTIGSVSGSAASYTVTVTGASGAGTMGLDLKSSGTGIIDTAGNAISGGFTAGQTFAIAPATGTPSISAPGTVTVGVGQAAGISPITISESPTTGGETFTLTLSDINGALSANTGAIGGGGTVTPSNANKTLTISGTLNQVNSDLTTLSINDPTTPTDTLSITLGDSNGGTATPASTSITVNGLPTISAPGSASVPLNQATSITPVIVSETGNTTTSGETFTLVASDGAGVLSANTGAPNGGGTITPSNGGETLTISGTLTQVNADLTTLADNDASLAADTITLTATDSFGNGTATATSIPVTVTPTTAEFDAHVYTDANSDGVQDNAEAGLAGVTVDVLDGSGNPTGTSGTTDSNGDISFSNLAPGSYELQVITPAGDVVSQSTNLQTPNTLAAGQTADAIAGVYTPPALLATTLSLTDAEGASLGNIWSQITALGIDPNPASLKVTAIGTSGTTGALVLDTASHSLTYVATGFNPSAPVDAFTFTLGDATGGSITGTVDVTITGANLPTTVVTTPGATGTATGAGQRLISEGTGQTLVGSSAGGDELFGGSDTNITASGNGNTINVLPGNHFIAMGANDNSVTLNDGNNTVSATGTGNSVTGGNGNDIITGMQGDTTIVLGNGNNTITISGADNSITVGTGTNHINAGVGGDETVHAGDGANTISAGGPSDLITAGNGANKITATGASATITAGNGGNTVAASGAGDHITTGSGNDTILDTAGSAVIKAGLGLNKMTFAGSSNDIVNQGGSDTLTDSGTNNTIALPLAGQGLDTINGSVLTNGDVFDLRAALASTTWDQQISDLGNYLSLGTSGSNALVQLSVTSGGTPLTIAVLDGAGSVTLATFTSHALLT